MSIEQDEDEIEYGMQTFSIFDALEEERELDKPEAIWPHWADGVPSKLRRINHIERFRTGPITHYHNPRLETLSLKWSEPLSLDSLRWNKSSLPELLTGVYRFFLRDVSIDRVCGKDPTGTLYIGRAEAYGSSKLHGRIRQATNLKHHAIQCWNYCKVIQQKFLEASIEVQWAYTPGEKLNERGGRISEAVLAESWLLQCYRDSFGELPPLNERI